MKKLTMFACFAKGLAGISFAQFHRLNIIRLDDDVKENYLDTPKGFALNQSIPASHLFSINKMNKVPSKREVLVVACILPWGFIFF